MAKWSDLKAAIADIIKTNGNQEITGQVLRNVLNNIISSVGENASFVDVATPTTNPGTPDGNVFYIAYTAGNYVNFQSKAGNLTVNPGELAILYNETTNWGKSVIGMSSDGVIALANITNQINATGRYAYTDTGIVRGSNAGSQKVRTFLVAGQPYKFTLTPIGGNAPVNIKGIKADGTFDTIGAMTSTPAGTTKTVTPTENYYGFTIFYGPQTTATSVMCSVIYMLVV
jgi:predicted RecA/RadA family phage recombinase